VPVQHILKTEVVTWKKTGSFSLKYILSKLSKLENFLLIKIVWFHFTSTLQRRSQIFRKLIFNIFPSFVILFSFFFNMKFYFDWMKGYYKSNYVILKDLLKNRWKRIHILPFSCFSLFYPLDMLIHTFFFSQQKATITDMQNMLPHNIINI